ncbi:hypothetical protein GGU10DRAFT_380774 [Lentinula aff. detonsa]|uniref:Uncharacterized protein n=1 Tax=Lentinula aff. detonsa TaxID=2804958 RepID=A0AA38L2N7_9AGAR|nr:hypothetical protein GGU10DRAFT_380774 [Lentinula aff. detonsa]
MSTTSSPACPVHSPTPVLNEEDAELQAFLVAMKREAQEKWEKLRAVKTSGVDVDAIMGVDEEVVPKVEPKPRKMITRMVAEIPRSCGMIPMSQACGGGVESQMAQGGAVSGHGGF